MPLQNFGFPRGSPAIAKLEKVVINFPYTQEAIARCYQITCMGTGSTKVIELSRDEWLSQLLLVMWRQMGIEDIEIDDGDGKH